MFFFGGGFVVGFTNLLSDLLPKKTGKAGKGGSQEL